MKRGVLCTLPILVLGLLLSGCAEIFEVNLFAPVDVIELPTAEKLAQMGDEAALAYLEREFASASFMNRLRANPSARADIESFLNAQTGIAPVTPKAVDPSDLPEWLWVTAEYYLSMYFGDEMVNNVAELFMSEDFGTAFDDEEGAREFLEGLFAIIVPPEALASEEAFFEMLDGFIRAWEAYEMIAAGFDGDPETETDRPGGSFNLGDFVQQALFAWLVDTAITPNALWATTEGAKAALWDLANGEEPDAELGDGSTLEEALSVGSTIDIIIRELGIEFFG